VNGFPSEEEIESPPEFVPDGPERILSGFLVEDADSLGTDPGGSRSGGRHPDPLGGEGPRDPFGHLAAGGVGDT
jgi:hypothetical protein